LTLYHLPKILQTESVTFLQLDSVVFVQYPVLVLLQLVIEHDEVLLQDLHL
jgi:hypothetical protein